MKLTIAVAILLAAAIVSLFFTAYNLAGTQHTIRQSDARIQMMDRQMDNLVDLITNYCPELLEELYAGEVP